MFLPLDVDRLLSEVTDFALEGLLLCISGVFIYFSELILLDLDLLLCYGATRLPLKVGGFFDVYKLVTLCPDLFLVCLGKTLS